MKCKFKMLVAMLVAAMILLTGCSTGGSGTAESSGAAESSGTADSSTVSSEPASKAASESSTDSKNEESVSITFWGGWTGPDVDTMQELVNQFMSEHPNINIEFESQQWTPLFTKFLAEASTGNAPHIIAMRPMDMGQFIEMDLMRDDFAETITIDSTNYSEAAWDGTMYQGKQYAVPLDQHMHGVFYNKTLFAEAGIDAVPTTGDELIEAAQLLTIDANGKNATESGFDQSNIVQYGLSFNMNHHVGFQMSALIKQQGEDPFTDDMTEVPFSDETAVNALTWIQDLVLKYNVVPVGDTTPVDSFVAGTAAMFIDGPWQIPTLEATDIDWDSTKYPNVFGEQVSWGNEHMFAFPVTETSEAQEEAIREFMEWMDQNAGEWAKSGQPPASISGQEAAAELEGREAFIDSMPNMYLLPASAKSAELFGSSATSPFVVAADSLLLDGNDPAEVVAQLRTDMNAILNMP